MLDRRLIAVSPDDAFGAQLAAALTPVDLNVQVFRDLARLRLDPLDGVLCVMHVAGDIAAGLPDFVTNLSPDCRIIAVLPRSSLVALVDIMGRSDRIVGMIVAEDFEPAQLLAMALRSLSGDVFGLEKIMAPETSVQAVLCEYEQRKLCRARVVAYAYQQGIRRQLATLIETCVDEMLMNALYDAPVDETGKHVFSGVPVRTRVSQKLATNVVVQFACDGKQFAVSVRDGFGSVERDNVLLVLHKCLHAAEKIDKKAGGAGVGLYLMVNASSAVYFNVIPGVATEVICVFQLARQKQQLDQFGYFRESRDVTGTLPTERLHESALRPTPIHVPLGPRLLVAGGIAAAVLLGLALWSHFKTDPPPPPPPKPATIELDSKPSGAAVEVNGTIAGNTPVSLTTFPPDTTLTIVLRREAFKDAKLTLRTPSRGQVTTHVETLVASADFVPVRFVSTPPGALLVDLQAKPGAPANRKYTPVELRVEAGKELRYMFTMPERVPVVVPPFTPKRGDGLIEKSGELVKGPTLHVEAAAGAVTVKGTPHCVALELPADCTLAAGDYEVDLVLPDGTHQVKPVKLGADDVTLTF